MKEILANHAGSHRFIGGFVNQNQGPRYPVGRVVVGEQRLGGANLDPGDVVHLDVAILLKPVEGVDVHLVLNLRDHGPSLSGGVFHHVFCSRSGRRSV